MNFLTFVRSMFFRAVVLPGALVMFTVAVWAHTSIERVFATPTLQAGDGVIEGFVFLDEDEDGELAPTEIGLAAFMVELQREDGTRSTRQTDGSGRYRFENLEPGSYTLRLVPRAGYTSTGIDLYRNLMLVEEGELLKDVDFAIAKTDAGTGNDVGDEGDARDEGHEAADDAVADDAVADDAAEEMDEQAMADLATAAYAAATGGELPAGVSPELSAMIASLSESQANSLASALADQNPTRLIAVAATLDSEQRMLLERALDAAGAKTLSNALAAALGGTAAAAETDADVDDDAMASDTDSGSTASAADPPTAVAEAAAEKGAEPSVMPEAGLADLGGSGLLLALAAMLSVVAGFGMAQERLRAR